MFNISKNIIYFKLKVKNRFKTYLFWLLKVLLLLLIKVLVLLLLLDSEAHDSTARSQDSEQLQNTPRP